MCAAALARAGVRRIVFGCANEKFGGCGTVMDVAGEGGGGPQLGKGLVGKAASRRLDGTLAGQARRLLQPLDEGRQGWGLGTARLGHGAGWVAAHTASTTGRRSRAGA